MSKTSLAIWLLSAIVIYLLIDILIVSKVCACDYIITPIPSNEIVSPSISSIISSSPSAGISAIPTIITIIQTSTPEVTFTPQQTPTPTQKIGTAASANNIPLLPPNTGHVN